MGSGALSSGIEMKSNPGSHNHTRMRNCRFCGAGRLHTFVDLGKSPLANGYLTETRLCEPEPFYPLHAFVCQECFLVQLDEFERPEQIFGHYAYFSSYSDIWLRHCESYAEKIIDRFKLGRQSHVIEVASNDGHLLQFFQKRGMHVTGIEPARNVAAVAEARGIPTLIRFFGAKTARDLLRKGIQADLLVGNNVLAHVPDLNDFVRGLKILLAPRGVLTLEFPHLQTLIEQNQFDTIYHEHFSYFSFTTVEQVFAQHGLTLFDVRKIPTHGGSLRIYARHIEADEFQPLTSRVRHIREQETRAGLRCLEAYRSFAEKAELVKHEFRSFLVSAKKQGHTVAAYGAPAKGNTLLNYCGVRSDLLEYTVDRSPHKQGMFLPGTHIPIHPPGRIRETMPRYLVILAWNLKDEIVEQMACIREWGGQFVIPIPRLRVFP